MTAPYARMLELVLILLSALSVVLMIRASRERRRAVRLAEDHRKRYISLFENSPDMVICYDPEQDRVVSANPAVYRLTGYAPGELDASTFRELYRSELDMTAVRSQYRKSATDEISRRLEAEIVDKAGNPLLISLTFFHLDLDGKRYIYSIGRDITAQRQAEREQIRAKEAAERVSRMKSDFLAMLSHEIRTPLNGMIGINQILMESELTPKQREMLEVQERSGASLLRVINDILDYSKMEAGALQLAEEKFHLASCVQEASGLFAIAAREKGIDLVCRTDAGVPEFVFGDPSRLRQVLVNLIGNAVKFTDSGCVEVELKVSEHASDSRTAAVECTVSDTGIGIDPSQFHLLFVPFSQLSTRAKNEGTGLGLAICKNLVESMGGRIWAETGREKGARFGIRIPFRIAGSEEKAV
ncbi:PAS domain-containing sensor histidine kinase [Cohnella caldifontis]|uniref:PAS domain-containing sensor histidine kinase n=1 Tax=Cohnella caldifontis TaxID=3027471 RepID=UPI0023EDFCCB|nr:PAS domain-containing hybrid sensor histidine kinase/response regulator [Cohnella sp. YIM B05605]